MEAIKHLVTAEGWASELLRSLTAASSAARATAPGSATARRAEHLEQLARDLHLAVKTFAQTGT